MKAVNLRNIKKYMPAVVFCVFIFAMGLLFLFLPKQSYSSNEKRYLSTFPEFNADTLLSGKFGTEFETFLSDHTAGRNFFVGLNAYYDLVCGRNGSNGVYACADNYLINVPVDTDNRLESNIQTLATFAADTNADASLLIVPSVGYIMEDKLPRVHDNYSDDAYFDIIEKNKGELNFINIKQLFKGNAQEKQLYYRTDHHWTTQGAYLAYTAYCAAQGITPAPESSFEKETFENFYGTTYSTSALWLTPPDDIELWRNKANEENVHVTIQEGKSTEEYKSMFFLRHLQEDDKYPVFLDGNHSLVRIQNKNSDGPKLLLIKDSFAHCMVPFLTNHYSEIVMVDMRYYKLPVSELMEQEGIDQVLMLYGLDNISTDTDLVYLQ